MHLSRRDMTMLFPLLAARAGAQGQGQGNETLPSKVYRPAQFPFTGDEKKKGRRYFHGVNHSRFTLDVHETALGPGVQTHTPHRHVYEEIIVILEGTVEAFIEGKTEPAEPGSVLYFGSNQLHTMRNIGTAPCLYCAIELRGDVA